MNSKSLEELMQHMHNKIDLITSLIPLAKLCANSGPKSAQNSESVTRFIRFDSIESSVNESNLWSKSVIDLSALSQMTLEMKQMLELIDEELSRQKQALIDQNERCAQQLSALSERCLHINTNIPTFLLKNERNDKVVKSLAANEGLVSGERSGGSDERHNAHNTRIAVTNKSMPSKKTIVNTRLTAKKTQKKLKQELNVNALNIQYITINEFNSIPKYMLGRLTYEEINRAIANFNRTIAAKYKLISGYSPKYNDEELRKFHSYKEQENSETNGEYFCTISDLKELSDLKVDNTIRKILTCMRHCKRVKEIRGPLKLIRYAICRKDVPLF